MHKARVAAERVDQPAVGDVPQSRGPVRRGEELAVRAEGQADNRLLTQVTQLLAGHAVQKDQLALIRSTLAARCQKSAVRAKGDGSGRQAMDGEVQWFAVGQAPKH